jgi:non-specific serine/threonine protein kinase
MQNLGIVATEQGDFERARALHRATLPLKQELGDREGLAASLVNVAYLTLRGGNAARAARLCGVAELACERIGAVLPAYERSLAERTVEEARGVLGTAAFTTHWVTGRRLSLDEAVAQALAPETAGNDVSPTVAGLTPRQLEVVRLVACGRTNRDIAEQLIIAKSTADRHVSDILSKLNLRTRLQLATWAIEHGLRTDPE